MDRKKIIWVVLAVIVMIAGFFLFAQKEGGLNFVESKSEFKSEEYKITFKYPSSWESVSEEALRYEGKDGFFQVSGAGGELSLADIIASGANSTQSPYGSKPAVEDIKIAGQIGSLILPSEDADPAMKDQAALILPYPGPIEINGEQYDYFILWADEDYIKGIAKTIEFLE